MGSGDMRDEIEAAADLTDLEIEAAKQHLRDRLRQTGALTGCTSYVQRMMGIGYRHAARILDLLEAEHFVSAPSGDRAERKLIAEGDKFDRVRKRGGKT